MAHASDCLRPLSAVRQTAAAASLCGALGVIAVFKWMGSENAAFCLVTVAVFIALPHVSLVLASWEDVAPKYNARPNPWRRVGIKLYGQLGLFAAVALAYFVFQGFSQTYLTPLYDFGGNLVLLVLIATVPYLWITDQRMSEPEDGLYHTGQLLLGQLQATDFVLLRQYLLSWVVKGFFGPLMAGFALSDMRWFLELPLSSGLRTPTDIFDAAYRMIYFVDVVFAVTGYLCTFRLLNSQIRSTEPTMLGWVVCLLCYPPFWNVFSNNFLNYDGGHDWMHWFANSSSIWLFWAALIIVSTLVYAWATISFGIRFSNLTNRGILTNGPYRWMKHPAYVAKNFSWWLIAMPFMNSSGLGNAIRDCAALALLNCIYYLRAKTEERHLSGDADYVAYCSWMETHSLYAKIKRRFT